MDILPEKLSQDQQQKLCARKSLDLALQNTEISLNFEDESPTFLGQKLNKNLTEVKDKESDDEDDSDSD